MVFRILVKIILKHCTEWVESLQSVLRCAMTMFDDTPHHTHRVPIAITTTPQVTVHCDNTEAHTRDRYIQLCRQHLQTLTAEKRPHIERVANYLGTNTMITSVIRNGIVHTNSTLEMNANLLGRDNAMHDMIGMVAIPIHESMLHEWKSKLPALLQTLTVYRVLNSQTYEEVCTKDLTSLILENSIHFTSHHPVFTTYSVLLNFITSSTSSTPMLQIIYRRDVCTISWVLKLVAMMSSCTITGDIHPRTYPSHIINDPQILSFSVMNACVSRRLRMTNIIRNEKPSSLAYRYNTSAAIDKVIARVVHCFTSDCTGSILIGRAEEMSKHDRFNDELYSIFELSHTSTEKEIYNELITPRTTEVEFCMQHAMNYNHHLVTNIWSKLGTLELDLSIQVFETSMPSTFAPTELYMQTRHPHIILIRHTREQVYTMLCAFPSITEYARYETTLANAYPCKGGA
jgi:hypothetical protein